MKETLSLTSRQTTYDRNILDDRIEKRLLRYALTYVREGYESRPIIIELTHEQLARKIDCSNRSITRAVEKLQKKGWIKDKQKRGRLELSVGKKEIEALLDMREIPDKEHFALSAESRNSCK